MNSINEALCLGVPMVAMPFLNDQITNARRLAGLGLAKQVRSFPSRGKELYRAVRTVYENAEFKENAEKMKQQLQNQIDWNTILNRIESLVN